MPVAGQDSAPAKQQPPQAKPAPEPGDEPAAGIDRAMEDVKAEGRRLAESARQEAHRFAESQKGSAAHYADDLAAAVNAGAEEMRRRGHRLSAGYADVAGDTVSRFAGRLDQRTPEDLVDDLEGFARRNPAMFYGGALLLGFGLARFFASRAPEPQEEPGASTRPTDPKNPRYDQGSV